MKEEQIPTLEDHENAKQEIAFLLNMLSQTIEDIVGKASGVVGRMAGNAGARKMPLFFESRDMQSVIQGIKDFLQGGFDITDRISNQTIELTFGRCALKDVCGIENIPLGGDLCMLFHNYMNGMIMELAKKEFRMRILETGDQCRIEHRAKATDRKRV